MPPRHSEEEQADFAHALVSVAEQGPLSKPEVDSLSMLEGADLARLREVWAPLPAGARARLVVALRSAAEQRLRLDFSALNQLALEDADWQVRLAGVRSAIEDRSPALLKKLIELVTSDPSVEVRFAAAEDLARFTLLGELEDLEPQATTELKNRLVGVMRDHNQAAQVRGSALAALGYFSDADTARELAAGFSDPILRLGAVRAMGRTADPRWTDRLMPVLGSDDPQLRLEAARALGELEDERAITPLVELLEDPEPDVQLAVIQALGQIGGEEAREALLFVAEAAEEQIREAASKALEEIEAAEADPMDL
ncbi:MAG: HEAT repeat domain-containing protein [Chloroflexota bacterium]